MAVTVSVDRNNFGNRVATWVGDGAAGNGPGVYFGNTPIKSVQRISGTGTYTVEGSEDGSTWGALGTAISAINDAVVRPIPESPAFLRVVTAGAAATVIIVGY